MTETEVQSLLAKADNGDIVQFYDALKKVNDLAEKMGFPALALHSLQKHAYDEARKRGYYGAAAEARARELADMSAEWVEIVVTEKMVKDNARVNGKRVPSNRERSELALLDAFQARLPLPENAFYSLSGGVEENILYVRCRDRRNRLVLRWYGMELSPENKAAMQMGTGFTVRAIEGYRFQVETGKR